MKFSADQMVPVTELLRNFGEMAEEEKYRIVWRAPADEKAPTSQIWGVGPREKGEIYRLIMKRRRERRYEK